MINDPYNPEAAEADHEERQRLEIDEPFLEVRIKEERERRAREAADLEAS